MNDYGPLFRLQNFEKLPGHTVQTIALYLSWLMWLDFSAIHEQYILKRGYIIALIIFGLFCLDQVDFAEFSVINNHTSLFSSSDTEK